jgi:hypothetical protein
MLEGLKLAQLLGQLGVFLALGQLGIFLALGQLGVFLALGQEIAPVGLALAQQLLILRLLLRCDSDRAAAPGHGCPAGCPIM